MQNSTNCKISYYICIMETVSNYSLNNFISEITGKKDFYEFINNNLHKDVSQLRLKYLRGRDDEFFRFAITQIECRRRFGNKINETLEAFPAFIFPDTLAGEQSTSDRLARFHADIANESESLVDLTSGLGIDVLHIAAKGAEVTACEMDSLRAQALQFNVSGMGLSSSVSVRNCDSVEALRCGLLSGRTAFIDPARRSDNGGRVFAISDCQPDITLIEPLMARHFHRLVAKLSPMLDVTAVCRSLHGVTDIYVIGTHTECRELVTLSNLSDTRFPDSDKISIHAVTLGNDDIYDFSFTQDEETDAETRYGMPVSGDTLVVPFPAVVKAGAFRLMASRNNLIKIAPNTQVYFCSLPVNSISGVCLDVIEVIPWHSKHIKGLKNRWPEAWVTCRNFGMTAAELQKRLGVRPRGDIRIFAVTDAADSRQLIVARPKTTG